jgi:hypothetical protein
MMSGSLVLTQNRLLPIAGNTSGSVGCRLGQRPFKAVPTSLPMEDTDTAHLLADEATKEFNVQQSDLPELMGMEGTSSIPLCRP